MIKNLLFDLGGVIMDIKRDDCVAAFQAIGMADADRYLGEYVQAGFFAGVENGSLSPAEFRAAVREVIDRDVTDSQIDHAFGCFLKGIPLHRLEELERLATRYDVYLLSNTNPIMWIQGIRRYFAQQGKDINHYFKGIVTSFEAKVMKPDPRIFRYAEQKLGIRPEETLFIDDSQTNLDAATALGFHTLLAAPGTEFYTELRKAGLAE